MMDSANHTSHVPVDYSSGLPATEWRTTPTMGADYCTVGMLNPVLYSNLMVTQDDYSHVTMTDIQGAMAGPIPDAHRAALHAYKDMLRDYPGYPAYPFGTKFQSSFTTCPDPDLTFMQALWLDTNQLICQTACAWLNANKFANYGYSPAEVVALYDNPEDCDIVTAFTIMNMATYS